MKLKKEIRNKYNLLLYSIYKKMSFSKGTFNGEIYHYCTYCDINIKIRTLFLIAKIEYKIDYVNYRNYYTIFNRNYYKLKKITYYYDNIEEITKNEKLNTTINNLLEKEKIALRKVKLKTRLKV